jgi:predicted SAM-dependent methyltransferase
VTTVTYLEPKTIDQFFVLVTDRMMPSWYEPTFPIGIVLNLGAGSKHIEGAIDLDLPDWDAEKMAIPYESESVSKIYAIHFLEHINNPIVMLRECQRVLKPGGVMNIGLPYYSSQGAFHDLDHKSFWCEETWRNLFGNEYYAKNHHGWKFRLGVNLIMGLSERNVMLLTQLIREA